MTDFILLTAFFIIAGWLVYRIKERGKLCWIIKKNRSLSNSTMIAAG